MSHCDAAPPQHRKDPPFPQRVMGAAPVVEGLPQPGDVAGVFADQQRRELLVDHRGQRLVGRHAADLGLGLAPPGQAAFGVDAHQRRIERGGPPEIAGVLFLGRDRDVHPIRVDRSDLHGCNSIAPARIGSDSLAGPSVMGQNQIAPPRSRGPTRRDPPSVGYRGLARLRPIASGSARMSWCRARRRDRLGS